MMESEKLAVAAHLHVLLRRKTGRVTDTEWMAANAEYAREIVRFARTSAKEDGHADLAEWAGKLESALGLAPVSGAKDKNPGRDAGPSSILPENGEGGDAEAPRYVRGIR